MEQKEEELKQINMDILTGQQALSDLMFAINREKGILESYKKEREAFVDLNSDFETKKKEYVNLLSMIDDLKKDIIENNRQLSNLSSQKHDLEKEIARLTSFIELNKDVESYLDKNKQALKVVQDNISKLEQYHIDTKEKIKSYVTSFKDNLSGLQDSIGNIISNI